MRATLTFDLIEEKDEFLTAIHGAQYQAVLQELDNYLRHLVKYENQAVVDIDLLRAKLHEELEDRDLRLWS